MASTPSAKSGVDKIPTVGVIVRGSTRDQIRDDLRSALQYAAQELGERWLKPAMVGTALDEIYGGSLDITLYRQEPGGILGAVRVVAVRTDNGPSWGGLQDLADDVSNGDSKITDVVAPRADRVQDGSLTPFKLLVTGGDVNLHLSEQGHTLHGGTVIEGTTKRIVRELADLDPVGPGPTEDAMTAEPIQKHTGGRPPLGFTSEAGVLKTNDKYITVCNELQRVADGIKSRRAAANAIGCAPATVDNALDRPALYGIDGGE